MTTLFISDLHLSDDNQETLKQFERFIQNQAQQAEALYILGDLFEVWVGDDDTSQAARSVAERLHDLSAAGTQIYYVHGNRDFLIGEKFAKNCGMTLLPDPTVIECEGKKILVTHGDLLCTKDIPYQKMRRIFHKNWVQTLFLALPRFIREKIGNMMRKQSHESHGDKNLEIMDADPETVDHWLETHKTDYMIHGHTHKPHHHQVKNTHRYVLGAWDIKPMIVVAAGGQLVLKQLTA